MKTAQAKPTDYGGVRYRSKSEAMFAVALGICFPRLRWAYEPRWLKCDDWLPDFGTVTPVYEDGLPVVVAIEYKPMVPTKSYIDQVASCVTKIDSLAFAGRVWVDVRIVYVDFFNGCVGGCLRFSSDCPSELTLRESGFNESALQSAAKQRFDLDHQQTKPTVFACN